MSTKPAAAIVSYESVAQAAEAITADGKRPSMRAVRAFLGGGSPNSILGFLQQWKAGRPLVRAEDVQVDPRIGQIVAEQIGKAVAEARAEIEARLTDAEQDAAELTKSGREAEEQIESLSTELDAARSQIQSQAGQIEQLKVDADQVKADAAAKVKTAEERAAGDVEKAQEQLKREQEAREAAQVALAKAELRLEALPRLEKEVARLQAALDAERTARTTAERITAGAEAKAAGLADRLADFQVRHKNLESEKQRLEVELADARREAKAAGEVAAELRGKLGGSSIVDLDEIPSDGLESIPAEEVDKKKRR